MKIWSWKKCLIESIRFGLITSFTFTLYWSITEIFDYVPTVTGIVVGQTGIPELPYEIYDLPFKISRWTDIYMAPAYATLVTTFFGRVRVVNLFTLVLGFCLFFGFVYGLVYGFAIGFCFSVFFGAMTMVAGSIYYVHR